MWERILQMAAESGVWAVMFVVLFYKQMKESKQREDKYQSTIDALAEKLKAIAEIRNDIADIKNAVLTGRTDVFKNEDASDKNA